MEFVVKVDSQTRLDPELESLIGQAQAILEAILRRSVDTVNATWTVGEDEKGRSIVHLDLSDVIRGLSVLTDFAPDELKDPDHLRQRLREVWGDLLQRQLEDIGNHLNSVLASEGINR